MSLTYEDPHYDAQEEARTTPGPEYPRPGSLADAIERGYDPADHIEGTY